MKHYFAIVLAVLFVAVGFCLSYYFLDVRFIDQCGWSTNEFGSCYLDETGTPISGWHLIDGSEYYFSPDTYCLHTGWTEKDGNLYYAQEGLPLTGWNEIDGNRYYFHADGVMHTGWLEIDHKQLYLQSNGILASGWTETPDGHLFFDTSGSLGSGITQTEAGIFCFQNGLPYSGWYDDNGQRYYFKENGSMYTGWLEIDGHQYYLKEDGTAAVGKYVIDGKDYFFSSQGVSFLLVNAQHPLPEDYTVEVGIAESAYLSVECHAALKEMFADCRKAGFFPVIMSGYRNIQDQTALFETMLREQLRKNRDYASAYQSASQIVAAPGTSEHHLGLAVDIVDVCYTELNHRQEQMPTQQWLMEHCWDYGFILRYPEGTTDLTGIIYEPWHYRYVGVEMAQEIRDLGVCLEEYVDMLTADGSRCNDGPMVEYELYRP